MRDYKTTTEKTYEHLVKRCPSRNKKIVTKRYPYVVNFFEDIEQVLCRMALVLGDVKPENDTDESIRDLFAEAFDSLFCAKNAIYEGYVGKAFPLMRQGYELMELMIYFILNPTKESVWRGKAGKKGKHIQQKDIREFLKSHPLGGDAVFKQKLYSYFSDASHTNRKHIPYRQLGISNRFTLGNFAHPNDIGVIEQSMRLIQLYAFLRHIVFTYYGMKMTKLDPVLPTALKFVSDKRATDVNIKLMKKFLKLLSHIKTK